MNSTAVAIMCGTTLCAAQGGDCLETEGHPHTLQKQDPELPTACSKSLLQAHRDAFAATIKLLASGT